MENEGSFYVPIQKLMLVLEMIDILILRTYFYSCWLTSLMDNANIPGYAAQIVGPVASRSVSLKCMWEIRA